MIRSRKTISASSPPSSSSGCITLSGLDRGQHMGGASFQEAVVDHQPDVEHPADQRLEQGHGHAVQEGGHLGPIAARSVTASWLTPESVMTKPTIVPSA